MGSKLAGKCIGGKGGRKNVVAARCLQKRSMV